VHVVELLNEFSLTPNVEIIEAGLPELGQEIVRVLKRKSELLGKHFLAWLTAEPARHALFQDLHDGGRSVHSRLADEQVNVVGHDDIAVAHFAQNRHKQILRARGGE